MLLARSLSPSRHCTTAAPGTRPSQRKKKTWRYFGGKNIFFQMYSVAPWWPSLRLTTRVSLQPRDERAAGDGEGVRGGASLRAGGKRPPSRWGRPGGTGQGKTSNLLHCRHDQLSCWSQTCFHTSLSFKATNTLTVFS